jgi:hypothetical protein
VVVDGRRPPAQALGVVPSGARIGLFEALLEDEALASVHDVSEKGLGAAFAALARLAERQDLVLPRLREKAAPAGPTADQPKLEGACVAWPVDREAISAARLAVSDPSLREVELPEAKKAGIDRGHILDLLASLEPVLTALSSPDISLIAIGSR